MAHSPSVDTSRRTHRHPEYEMCSLRSTPSSQVNLAAYSDRSPIERERTTSCSPALNFRLAIGILWIAPVIALLHLNFTNHVIGGAAWCPEKPCGVISYYVGTDVTTNTLIGKSEKANRNLLGTLQFVAKGLEVWFAYIATSLVYLVTYAIAERKGGVPTGYLLTYLKYGDIRSLFDTTLYGAPRTRRGQNVTGNRIHTRHLYIIPALAVSMYIVANCMGPSLAILLLPTLHWKDTRKFPDVQFDRLEADSPPAGTLIPNCTADELNERNYTCFQNHHHHDLDALIITHALEMNKIADENATAALRYLLPNSPILYEGVTPFIFNLTQEESAVTTWALNRQVLRLLSKDFEQLFSVIQGDITTNHTVLERYKHCNSSRSLNLQRQGPIIGLRVTASLGNSASTVVDNGRSIHCYKLQDFDNLEMEKCYKSGQRDDTTNAVESFTINTDGNKDLLPINMRIYWSDQRGACFDNGTTAAGKQCDHDATHASGQKPLFSDEYTVDTLVMELSEPNSTSVFVTEFELWYGFATYTFDATTIFPILNNVEVTETPRLGSNETYRMAFDPAWVLAAWGLNAGDDLSSDRSAVSLWQAAANKIFNNSANGKDWSILGAALQFTVLQAASLVPFTGNHTDNLKLPSATKRQPVLWTNTKREIWGWSIQGRTSILGAVVAILGILTALARTALLIITRERERGSTELIGAALQYNYKSEFGDTVQEKVVARVRYRVGEDKGTGKLKFIPA